MKKRNREYAAAAGDLLSALRLLGGRPWNEGDEPFTSDSQRFEIGCQLGDARRAWGAIARAEAAGITDLDE